MACINQINGLNLEQRSDGFSQAVELVSGASGASRANQWASLWASQWSQSGASARKTASVQNDEIQSSNRLAQRHVMVSQTLHIFRTHRTTANRNSLDV